MAWWCFVDRFVPEGGPAAERRWGRLSASGARPGMCNHVQQRSRIWPRAEPDSTLTVNLILGSPPADRRSNLACSRKRPSTFTKVLNMQRKGSNMLDVVGSGRLAASRRVHQSDAACWAWRFGLSWRKASESSRYARGCARLSGTQLQVTRLDVLRLDQPRFPISCHSRPQVRRSPEL